MSDVMILGPDDLLLLHRHYINLTCVDSGDGAKKVTGGKPKRYNFSAFVVEVEGEILAITAGHIFSELQNGIDAGAIVLTDWAIDDSMVCDSALAPYPINVNFESNLIFFDQDGLDYAALLLGPLTKTALSMRGIVPIAEENWNAEDLPDFPFWTLIGSPMQFAQLRHDGPSQKNHVTVMLRALEDPPPALADQKYQRLYASIEFESVAEWERHFDIGGMSGGPIFGTRVAPQGNGYEYRLIAIQSSWDERENVAMCAAQPFLRALAGLVRSRSPGGHFS